PLTFGFGPQWQPVYNQRQTLILRNDRAMPRAWLVSKAEAVDGEEALRRIRGESAHPFDPQQTVLLEIDGSELPLLSGTSSSDNTASIVRYGPNRIELETNSSTATVLVLSEIFYPGWQATVDGQPTRILLADYLLRGVSLPPGSHSVVMKYAAPAARTGAIISFVTFGILGLIVFHSRRTRKTERN
ncbi:MAG: hypothetical protein C5B55_12085, partial [Blastocatellia bacterium]